MSDIFAEAAAELGCDVSEIEGTFPPSFLRALRPLNAPLTEEEGEPYVPATVKPHKHADGFVGTHSHPGYGTEHTHEKENA